MQKQFHEKRQSHNKDARTREKIAISASSARIMDYK
jgi:hypothetical protein